MTRRVVEKLCTKKVCVDFLAPSDATGLAYRLQEISFRDFPKGPSRTKNTTG